VINHLSSGLRVSDVSGLSREACHVLEWLPRSRGQSNENGVPLSIRQAQWIQDCLADHDMAFSHSPDWCPVEPDEFPTCDGNQGTRGGPAAFESIFESNDWMVWDCKNSRSGAEYFVKGLTLWYVQPTIE
jgi:hypothetical protein